MATNTAAFRVLLRMDIAAGKEDDFEKTWLAIGDAVTRHPANLGQWLMRSTDDAGVYFIISDWVDEPGFREFERSDEHVDHRVELHPFRVGGDMTTMLILHHLLPGGASAS